MPPNTDTIQYGGNLSNSVLNGGFTGFFDHHGGDPQVPSGWGACAASALAVGAGAFALWQGPLGVAEIGAISSLLGFGEALNIFGDNIQACENVLSQALGTDQSNADSSMNDLGMLGDLGNPSGLDSGQIQFGDPTANVQYSGNSTDAWGNGDDLWGSKGEYTPADWWGGSAKPPPLSLNNGHFTHF